MVTGLAMKLVLSENRSDSLHDSGTMRLRQQLAATTKLDSMADFESVAPRLTLARHHG